jgi:hypothetical protein
VGTRLVSFFVRLAIMRLGRARCAPKRNEIARLPQRIGRGHGDTDAITGEKFAIYLCCVKRTWRDGAIDVNNK